MAPAILFAQDEKLLGLERDSVLNDSGYYDIVYRLVDTIGEFETGNYYIKVEVLDSVSMVKRLYKATKDYYDRLGEFEGMKISALQQGAAFRNKATEMTGQDNYRVSIMPEVRREMQGNYILRYDNQTYRVNLLENGVARDEEDTLIFTNVPLSSTWTVISYRIGEIDNVQVYKIREGIWLGDGEKGRMILRKI